MVELTTYLPDFENGQLEENNPIFLLRATGGSNKAEHSAPYGDSGSDSGDQFKPAEDSKSEEEDDLQGDVEVEVESEDESQKESTKVKSKKSNLKPGHSKSEEEDNVESEDEGKSKSTKMKSKKGNWKPGRKHIIATQKINATAGTPSTTATSIKSGANENDGNAR